MDLLGQLFLSFVGTLAALFIALRQHRSNHVWNEKFRVYSEIIGGLTKIITYSNNCAGFYYGRGNKPTEAERHEYELAIGSLYDLSVMSEWILSPTVGEILSCGQPDPDDYDEDDTTYDYYSDVARARREQLEVIVKEARKELGFGLSWWQRAWPYLQKHLPLAW